MSALRPLGRLGVSLARALWRGELMTKLLVVAYALTNPAPAVVYFVLGWIVVRVAVGRW